MTAMPGPSAPAQQLLTQWSQIYMTAMPGPSAPAQQLLTQWSQTLHDCNTRSQCRMCILSQYCDGTPVQSLVQSVYHMYTYCSQSFEEHATENKYICSTL